MTQSIDRDRASDLTCAVLSLAPVLLTGDSPSERERHARLIHRHGYYSNGPFISYHYPPHTESVPEVVHREAAATDEHRQELQHLLEQAKGGTVFLDHIENLSEQGQRTLFSALEQLAPDRASSAALKYVRIIAGTGRYLNSQVAAGVFMEALYYRLNMIHLDLRSEGT